MKSAGADAEPSNAEPALFRALLEAIETVGNGLRQHRANESLRRSFARGQTASDAFATRVAALVTTVAVIDQWLGADALRTPVDRALFEGRWGQLLDAVEQRSRPAAAVIDALDGVLCARDELASLRELACEDHRVDAALSALSVPAALRPIEASSFVSAIEAAHRNALRVLVDVWAVHFDERLLQTPVALRRHRGRPRAGRPRARSRRARAARGVDRGGLRLRARSAVERANHRGFIAREARREPRARASHGGDHRRDGSPARSPRW